MESIIEFALLLLLYILASMAACVSFLISPLLGILVVGIILGVLGLDVNI